ncbi:MAG: hypothetical protein EOO41_02800, partial [Methanobacteriota archaeon]
MDEARRSAAHTLMGGVSAHADLTKRDNTVDAATQVTPRAPATALLPTERASPLLPTSGGQVPTPGVPPTAATAPLLAAPFDIPPPAHTWWPWGGGVVSGAPTGPTTAPQHDSLPRLAYQPIMTSANALAGSWLPASLPPVVPQAAQQALPFATWQPAYYPPFAWPVPPPHALWAHPHTCPACAHAGAPQWCHNDCTGCQPARVRLHHCTQEQSEAAVCAECAGLKRCVAALTSTGRPGSGYDSSSSSSSSSDGSINDAASLSGTTAVDGGASEIAFSDSGHSAAWRRSSPCSNSSFSFGLSSRHTRRTLQEPRAADADREHAVSECPVTLEQDGMSSVSAHTDDEKWVHDDVDAGGQTAPGNPHSSLVNDSIVSALTQPCERVPSLHAARMACAADQHAVQREVHAVRQLAPRSRAEAAAEEEDSAARGASEARFTAGHGATAYQPGWAVQVGSPDYGAQDVGEAEWQCASPAEVECGVKEQQSAWDGERDAHSLP